MRLVLVTKTTEVLEDGKIHIDFFPTPIIHESKEAAQEELEALIEKYQNSKEYEESIEIITNTGSCDDIPEYMVSIGGLTYDISSHLMMIFDGFDDITCSVITLDEWYATVEAETDGVI